MIIWQDVIVEVEVAHVIAMKVGSKERKHAWSTLLKEGDYLHNCEVAQVGKGGTFIPMYRSRQDKKLEDFVPCSVCHGLCKKSLLYLHVQRFGKKHGVSVSTKRKAAIVEGELLWPAVSSVNKAFREKVIWSMKDDIRKFVLKDDLIVQHGERMYMKKDVQISSRMRLLGKLMKILHMNESNRI